MTQHVKFLHAPGHAGSMNAKVIARAVSSEAALIDFTEMYHDMDHCHAAGYTFLTVEGKRTDTRGRNVGHDIVVAVKTSEWVVVHHGPFFVDHELHIGADGNKYHPERWGVYVLIRHRKTGVTILGIFAHPQPGPNRHPEVKTHYEASLKRIGNERRSLVTKFRPDHTVMASDAQLGAGSQWISPNMFYARQYLAYWHDAIDWFAHDHAAPMTEHHVISKAELHHYSAGLDHPWLETTLEM